MGCRLLGLLLAVDVRRGTPPSHDLAAFTPERHHARKVPSIGAVGTPQPPLELAILPRALCLVPAGEDLLLIIGMEGGGPATPVHRSGSETRVFQPVLVAVLHVAAGGRRPHE